MMVALRRGLSEGLVGPGASLWDTNCRNCISACIVQQSTQLGVCIFGRVTTDSTEGFRFLFVGAAAQLGSPLHQVVHI